MKPCLPLLLAGLCGLAVSVSAQTPLKFGDVAVADLQTRTYPPDSAAQAVVLFDVATTRYEVSNGGFGVRTERHTRLKILGKAGYDYATIRVLLFRQNAQHQELLENLRGFTYNLENGQVTKDKLNKDAVFEYKKEDGLFEKRFTMPNVREGSIIEYTYSVRSDFWWQLDGWVFQRDIPVAWSEYRLVVPEYFNYRLNAGGYEPLVISEQTRGHQNFNIMQRETVSSGNASAFVPQTGARTEMYPYNVQANTTEYHFAARNLPALRDEAYITTLADYVTKIDFELASVQFPGERLHTLSDTWQTLNQTLLQHEYFGGALRQRGFLKDVARSIPASPDTALRAAAACDWVRQRMKWNGTETKYVETSLKKAFDAHTGNSADLNLLLVALLREAGLEAAPVILSTRDHGRVMDWHAQLAKFNYVVAAARVGNGWLLLDATDPVGKPGVLPLRCLNGKGWLVSETEADFVSLAPTERHVENVVLTLGLDAEGGLKGLADLSHGGYAGSVVRRQLLSDGPEKYILSFGKTRPSWEFTKLDVTTLDDLSQPVGLRCDVRIAESVQAAGGRMYFKPLLTEGETANPFRLAERKFPVDFAAPINQNFTAVYTLPEGYVVEELPQKAVLALPDNAGRFTYVVAANGNQVQVTSRIAINKTLFMPDEYPLLKTFFDKIVAKHAEQVVLKKQ